jgi:hypothetical protein
VTVANAHQRHASPRRLLRTSRALTSCERLDPMVTGAVPENARIGGSCGIRPVWLGPAAFCTLANVSTSGSRPLSGSSTAEAFQVVRAPTLNRVMLIAQEVATAFARALPSRSISRNDVLGYPRA